jgi:outer membrane cobalamin receptor
MVGMSFAVRWTRAEPASKAEIPYVPRFLATGTLQHALAFGLRVSSDIRFTGNRYADVQNARKLSPLLLWDVRTEFGSTFRMGAEVTNLLDRREGMWEGYSEEPRRIALSIGFTW